MNVDNEDFMTEKTLHNKENYHNSPTKPEMPAAKVTSGARRKAQELFENRNGEISKPSHEETEDNEEEGAQDADTQKA